MSKPWHLISLSDGRILGTFENEGAALLYQSENEIQLTTTVRKTVPEAEDGAAEKQEETEAGV